jgi:hypothetical protein
MREGAWGGRPLLTLFVAGDALFLNRRAQFATLTARDRIPATFSQRDYVEAGGLMSYGTDIVDSFSSSRRLYGQNPQGREAGLAQPGGNVTGNYFLVTETATKRLRLLHDMVPKAVRVAVLVNPVNTSVTKVYIAGCAGSRPLHRAKYPDP